MVRFQFLRVGSSQVSLSLLSARSRVTTLVVVVGAREFVGTRRTLPVGRYGPVAHGCRRAHRPLAQRFLVLSPIPIRCEIKPPPSARISRNALCRALLIEGSRSSPRIPSRIRSQQYRNRRYRARCPAAPGADLRGRAAGRDDGSAGLRATHHESPGGLDQRPAHPFVAGPGVAKPRSWCSRGSVHAAPDQDEAILPVTLRVSTVRSSSATTLKGSQRASDRDRTQGAPLTWRRYTMVSLGRVPHQACSQRPRSHR